jgi:hypothetical protein
MATTNNTDIQQLYVAYFNRPADPVGLKFWADNIAAGKATTADVAKAFSAQAEYTAAFKDMTNAQIVNQVYMNLFSRSSAGDTGADFWVKGLENKTITIADVVTAVAAGAQGTDKTAFANKVTAAGSFTAALDTQAEINGYAGDDANAIAKAFLAGITTDTTLAAATAPSALNATVASAVAAGTPFSVTGALAALNAANQAEAAFLVTADGDKDAKTSADETSLKNAVSDAADDVATALGTTGATFTAGSDAVKAALISDKIAADATQLTKDQATLAAKTTAVGEVKGLTAAVAALDAATAVKTSATKADTAAKADLAAKEAAFEINNGVTVTFNADGTATYVKGTAAAADLIVKDADTGALTLADSTAVTEAKMPGVTALLNASTALEVADTALTKAGLAVDAATLEVHHTDVDATNGEAAALKAVADAFTTIDLKGAMPTEAQIASEIATLTAKKAAGDAAATTALNTLTPLVSDYHTKAASDPTVKAQSDAAAAVKLDTDGIKAFADAVAAYNDAKATLASYDGYHATVEAAEAVFADNGYTVHNLGASTTTEVGTAASDLYVAGTANMSIVLFGLQGKDALYIGSDYTLNTTKDQTGVDTVKEVFIVGANGGADTQIVLEKTAFGSSAATPEVVTITLTGVAAADVHLNNGIITVGGTTV